MTEKNKSLAELDLIMDSSSKQYKYYHYTDTAYR